MTENLSVLDSAAAPGGPAPASAAAKRPGNRYVLITVGILALGAAGVWLLRYWTHGRFVESTNDAYLQADQVNVTSRVSGFVEQVYVRDNQAVAAGDPLVKLDERDPRARLEQAQAQVDQGKAAIAQAQAQISQQQAQVLQLGAELEATRTQAALADKQVARYAALVKTGAETDERYDQLRQARDQSRAQVERDSAALLAARRVIGTYTAQIGEARAQIEQAQALARRAQIDLDATLLRASVSGRIGDRTARIGSYVQTGDRLMTVVPVDDLYLVANFKETQLGGIRAGQPATIAVDALGGREIGGTVDSFSPGTGAQFALIPPSNATGNFTKIVQRVPVRIKLQVDEDVRRVLVPGLSVTVDVDTRETSR